jgi:hypothetical protein
VPRAQLITLWLQDLPAQMTKMRALTAIIIASFLLAGSAYGQNGSNNENASFLTPKSVTADNNALIVIAQDTTAKPKKKIKLRRVCPVDQIRCACADTGTSACCKATQTCSCQPTANCR